MAEEKEIARQNLINVTAEEKERKIRALKANRDFVLKSFFPVSDNCHFERYNFVCGKEKLSIVYDTKAHLFTLTALAAVLDQAAAAMAKEVVHKKPDVPLTKPGGAQLKTKSEIATPAPTKQNTPKQNTAKQSAPKQNTPKQNTPKQNTPKQNKPQKKQAEKQKAVPPQKISARTLKSLHRLMPDAFDLLGEQSRIDLGIGMTDINGDVKLSDYSVLLVPPYRGLERFIYDLQQARGITVKMIGQAYEKDANGIHVLKQCYRKKNEIVYAEVMSALYVEYFARRNFYAHSDNSLIGANRVIESKDAAKAIFDNLCKIINYNGKKLKEIGFSAFF